MIKRKHQLLGSIFLFKTGSKSLENHLIPNAEDFIDGLYDDDYMVFLEERAKSIYRLVKKIKPTKGH